MAAPEMRYRLGGADGAQQPRMALRRQRRGGMPGGGGLERLLLDSGCVLMLLGALVLTWRIGPCAAAEHVFIAFLLWLLGTAAAMLSLVAPQFPGLAAAGAAAATALRNYLLGGL